MWIVARQVKSDKISLNSEEQQEESTLDNVAANIHYFAGSASFGKPANQEIYFTLHVHGDESESDRFLRLASEAGAAILSPRWLQRLDVSASAGPITLWLAFVLHFAHSEQRQAYRIIRGLYAQSILAIERSREEGLITVPKHKPKRSRGTRRPVRKLAATPNGNRPRDGPDPPNAFAWQGHRATGLQRIPWRLLNFVGERPRKKCPQDEAIGDVWGRDDVTSNAIKMAVKKVNNFVSRAGCPRSLSQLNGCFEIA
jgi:hypothetical protein